MENSKVMFQSPPTSHSISLISLDKIRMPGGWWMPHLPSKESSCSAPKGTGEASNVLPGHPARDDPRERGISSWIVL